MADDDTKLVPLQPGPLESVGSNTPRDTFALILRNWLADKTEVTKAGYSACLQDFARFCQRDDPREAAFIWAARLPPHEAYQVAVAYKADMLQRGLHPATINQRLSCLRSISVAASEAYGTPPIRVKNAKLPKSAKTGKSVSDEQWRAVVRAVESDRNGAPPGSRGERMSVRLLAIVRLLHDVSLRRKEVAAMERKDVHFESRRVTIHPKGARGSRIDWPVEGRAWDALIEWVELRGDEPGPLFGFSHPSRINTLLTELGKRLGFPLRPHMLRHHGITMAGRVSRESATDYARHADPKTTMIYMHDDHEQAVRDIQRQIGEDKEDGE